MRRFRFVYVGRAAAQVVERLVVDHECAIGVIDHRMRREDGVVRLDDRRGDLRGGVHGELELGLLAVVDGEALEQQ
jgi:hypothetical protein